MAGLPGNEVVRLFALEGKAEVKLKRLLLFILVLILLVDFAEDGHLGRVKICPSHHSAKTSITASHNHPNSGSAQSDFWHEPGAPNGQGSPSHGEARPVSPQVWATLQIMHCCHLSSAGGIPQ